MEWVVEGHEGRDARVSWHSSLEDVPRGVPTLFIGQEVLDAFPPYQFVKTGEGWREKLVDLDDSGGFRFVLAPQPTPASRALAQGSPTVSKAHLEEALQDITPAATRADGDLARRAPHGLLDVAAHSSVRSYLKRFLRSGAPGATRSVLLVPEVRGAGCTAHAAVAARDAAFSRRRRPRICCGRRAPVSTAVSSLRASAKRKTRMMRLPRATARRPTGSPSLKCNRAPAGIG